MRANRQRIRIFNGTAWEVEDTVNRYLRSLFDFEDLVAIEYNYQAPEYDQAEQIIPATHGVLLVLASQEEE